MTLQQKLLAKKSKKGFTLVELVVVIAILAILAAIAIPMVVNIINSASQSSTETDAASIDAAVKSYHAAITSGSLNKSNAPTTLSTKNNLPEANASNKTRSTYANSTAKVKEAMEWDGIYDRLTTKLSGGDFGYAAGSVVAAIDGNGNPITATANGTAIKAISETTLISNILNDKGAAAQKP